jgi:hypothetical protein
VKLSRYLLLGSLLACEIKSIAGEPTFALVPRDQGFDGSRYEDLWSKSPFAIATSDAPAASEDYQLVGLAQFDGVSYVSLVDKQTQNHFVLTSVKPVKNLSLVSISRGEGPGNASAVIMRNGEALTLHEVDTPSQAVSGGPIPIPIAQPGMTAPSNPSVGGVVRPSMPPRVRIHRPPIIVPPPREPPTQ